MDGCQTTRLLKNLHRLPEIVGAYRHAGDWLDLSLRYLGMASPSFPYDVRLRDGVRFRFESTEEIRVFWNIFLRPTYHVGPDDRLILDAGREHRSVRRMGRARRSGRADHQPGALAVDVCEVHGPHIR